MGDALAAMGRQYGLTDQDLAVEGSRTPAEPLALAK